MKFTAPIEIRGINPYILVRAEIAMVLREGWRKPLPVLLRINGALEVPWRINMMPVGNGDFYLYLHGEVRAASKTVVGDTVTVELSFDADYQGGPMHPMADWFQEALERDAAAKQSWEALPPSRQKEVLRYFDGLKSEEARERNPKKLLFVLSGNEERFMARIWKNSR